MATDLTLNTYTIKSVNDDGSVTVIFDCDGKSQTLANAPVGDSTSLKSFLSDYLSAYKQGLQTEQSTADSSVTALVGKKQTADTGA